MPFILFPSETFRSEAYVLRTTSRTVYVSLRRNIAVTLQSRAGWCGRKVLIRNTRTERKRKN